MIILAIDPSINNTGWAVLRERFMTGHPVEVGYHGVWRPQDKDPYERLRGLCDRLDSAINEFDVTDVVIETTSGKVGARHKGGGAGLAQHGVAVGGLIVEARSIFAGLHGLGHAAFTINLVLENLWTAGQPKHSTDKRTGRHEQTLAEFGLPKKTTDHETDAIALGTWWYANRKLLAVPAEDRRNGKT